MITGHHFPLLAASLILTCMPSAKGAVTFDFDFSDPSASLFTPEARAALANAGQKVASYFINYTATVTISMTAYHDPAGDWANAGTNFNLTGGNPGFDNPGVVGAKIRSNGTLDQNGADPDGFINVNMGDWYGYSDSVDSSLFDFTTTMTHELGHALGYGSNISQQGTTAFDGYYVPYCEFLTNSAGQKIVSFNSVSGLWEVDVPLWLQASTGGAGNGVFFSGSNAMAANGGNRVPLFSPQPFLDGSSIAHPDPNVFTNSIMSQWDYGTGPRDYSAVELGILKDIGYTQIVPEPGSGLLVLLGLGVAARRQRRPSLNPARHSSS